MRSTLLLGHAAVLCLALGIGARSASAEPRHKQKKESDTSDRTLDKQMAWEQKVMGEDGAKKADMKKIAAAQKLADEGRNNPEPTPPPKVKDPNKEGVRAKQEASIGLPIASDEAQSPRATKKSAAAKKDAPSTSANDELGALVASSLAEDKSSGSATPADLFGSGSGSSTTSSSGSKAKRPAVAAKATSNKGKKKAHAKARARGKGKARASAEPSSLDRMFASAN